MTPPTQLGLGLNLSSKKTRKRDFLDEAHRRAALAAGGEHRDRGKTPALTAAEFAELRFGMVLYANAALQGAVHGMTNALRRLRADGVLDVDAALVATFQDRQEQVRKDSFDELEKRH